jgi:ATP-dependent helicase/nuclease subunit A
MDQKKVAVLSAAQKQAVTTLDRNLCVAAGAGSGKTTVLVERFLNLAAAKNIRPDRVVAITYTEKAANHMKEKLVREFTRRRLFEERRALENACIGTIHSFAARLLRENPIEAGCDPRFAVLEPGAAGILMDAVLEEIVEANAARPEILGLLGLYGEERVRTAIKAVYGKIRSRPAREVPVFDYSDLAAARWQALAERLDLFLRPRAAAKASKTYENNLRLAADLRTAVRGAPRPLGAAGLDALAEIAQGLKRQGEASEIVGEIKQIFEEAAALETEVLGRKYRDAFLDLFRQFSDAFAARKNRGALLDFDDLLIKAYELVRPADRIREALLARFRERFQAILIDEFQDTSRLQAEWLTLLSSGANLFLVGDAKQSIYRFRNADLEVFLEKEKSFASGGGQAIPLNDNFRSRPEILDFVNALFEKIWKEDSFPFSPLAARREFAGKAVPSVEFLCERQTDGAGGEEKESIEKARVREARALAGRIQELVETRALTVTERDGRTRDAVYGDFAVLFRAMTHSAIYERELRDRDIPYFVVRGRGFYDRQEVADLMNFLEILEDPDQDIPLAAVLRSPLAGLSDDALYWLSRVKEKDETVPLSRGLEDAAALSRLRESDRDKLEAFRALWGRLRPCREEYRASEILSRAVRETNYGAVLLGLPDGRQRWANVRKLIDIARGFEAQEAFGLSDFIRYVRELSVEETRESEAQVEMEKSDSVKLLTVHKAKGLEFPVVAIADLGGDFGPAGGGDFNFSEARGLGFRIKSPATRKWREGHVYAANKEEDRRKETEESKRLFYVAATRAEEHLILSGVSRMKDPEDVPFRDLPTWMEWLRAAFRGAPVSGDVLDFQGHPVRLAAGRTPDAAARPKRPLPAEGEPFGAALAARAELEESASEEAVRREFEAAVRGVKKEYFETRDASVSALLVYDRCPGCYDEIYRMRAPDDSAEEKEAESGGDETALSRREFGTLFHRVLENFDFAAPEEAELARGLTPLSRSLRDEDFRELERSVRGFLKSPWAGRFRDKEARLYREVPFLVRFERGELSGQIDLVLRTPSETVILDYKTGRVKTEADIRRQADAYELQILIYASAVWISSGLAPEKGALYFTSLDRTIEYNLSKERLAETRAKVNRMFEEIARGPAGFPHRAGCGR